jgi:hypothetical protein
LILDSCQSLSERAAGFLASFDFAGLEQSQRVVAEASGLLHFQNSQFQSQKGPAWLLRFAYITQFLQGTNLKWLLHFLMISGELDSIINAFGGNGQGGLFPPL